MLVKNFSSIISFDEVMGQDQKWKQKLFFNIAIFRK